VLSIITEHPLAEASIDHRFPRGTMQDNSTNPAFNRKLFTRGRVRLLDLGCAGGGLVASILADGGFAVGIEGSNYSRLHNRAEWPIIPANLFTADITKPFRVEDDGKLVRFNYITAWEFFEHIRERDLDGVFANIRRHLEPDGCLIVSVALIGDYVDGHEYHPTVEPAAWWLETFADYGYSFAPELTAYIDPDWVRGPNTGNTQSLCAVFQ